MRKVALTSALVLLSLMLSTSAFAQRRGRGGDAAAAGAPPTLLTEYANAEFGLAFPAPPDFSVFTPDHPGNFREVFTERRIVYLVDLMGKDASVVVKYLPAATEADLQSLKGALEANPPEAKLSGYKKISVGEIKIGQQGDRNAVEYVYSFKDKSGTVTTRQVAFIHKGKGFIFTCKAAEKDYTAIDKKSFQRLFATIDFN